jgi:hypothetical protein
MTERPGALPPSLPTLEEDFVLSDLEISAAVAEQYGVAKDPEAEQQRLEIVHKIRDREPTEIAYNAAKAVAGIEQFYAQEKTSGKRGLLKGLSSARHLRELHKKATEFGRFFDETVFSDIEHATRNNIGENVELKSPQTLAVESGTSIHDNGPHSGGVDVAMGNANYVFANTNELVSFTGVGSNRYKITSDDGYAVPVDVAYTDIRAVASESEDYAVRKLGLYADNIYTIPDFKTVFALYGAALFDSPQDAVGFYKTFKHMMAQARRWDLDDKGDGSNYHKWDTYGPNNQNDNRNVDEYATDRYANDRAHTIALRMRELVEDYGIYPPLEPEFQFKGKVEAARIGN